MLPESADSGNRDLRDSSMQGTDLIFAEALPALRCQGATALTVQKLPELRTARAFNRHAVCTGRECLPEGPPQALPERP